MIVILMNKELEKVAEVAEVRSRKPKLAPSHPLQHTISVQHRSPKIVNYLSPSSSLLDYHYQY